MTKIEKLADDIGQVAFRIATNTENSMYRISKGLAPHHDALLCIKKDVELLKKIKTRVQALER